MSGGQQAQVVQKQEGEIGKDVHRHSRIDLEVNFC